MGLKTYFELSRTSSHQELPVFIINEIIIEQYPGIILAIFILDANNFSFDGFWYPFSSRFPSKLIYSLVSRFGLSILGFRFSMKLPSMSESDMPPSDSSSESDQGFFFLPFFPFFLGLAEVSLGLRTVYKKAEIFKYFSYVSVHRKYHYPRRYTVDY